MMPALERLRHLVALGDAAAHDELQRALTRLGMAECVAPPVPEIDIEEWTRRYAEALDMPRGEIEVSFDQDRNRAVASEPMWGRIGYADEGPHIDGGRQFRRQPGRWAGASADSDCNSHCALKWTGPLLSIGAPCNASLTLPVWSIVSTTAGMFARPPMRTCALMPQARAESAAPKLRKATP